VGSELLYGKDVDEEEVELSRSEQASVMLKMRAETVRRSETTCSVVFKLEDRKVAYISGPPGRLVLSGRPY
jgi:hypothetical protein